MMYLRKFLYLFCTSCQPNKSATVRFAFPLIFAFAALLGTAAVISSSSTYIHLESSATSVKAGDAFQIKVYVNAQVPVNAVDISLKYPDQQIKIEGIDTGQSVITLWTQDPYVQGDEVILRGGIFRRGFIGDHLIATINARATETGLAQFSTDTIVLLAGDGTGSTVDVTDKGKNKTALYVSPGAQNTLASTNGVNLQGTVSIVIVTDIDGDGVVTLADVSKFMFAWANKNIIYDFNGDGSMSFRDFGIILYDSFSFLHK